MNRRERIEEAVKACYAGWSESYHRDYCGQGASYPPVHYALLRGLLQQAGARTVLDAGCGPASFLRELAGTDIEAYGFDLTPEMADEGRRVFASLGWPAERLWEGSILDAASFAAPSGPGPGGFDAVICSGVFPHIRAEDEETVLENLREAVRPGGLVAVEARNALFALFSLNRYSMEFFAHDLMRLDALADALPPEKRDQINEAVRTLEDRFRMDQPPPRQGSGGAPGYDEVLARTHNSFVLRERFVAAGLRDVRVLFYHYHCVPPMLAEALGDSFREASLAMEDPEDWRGHFMASAFIMTGVRP
jgi:SAM-dependent methyltransferase